MGNRFDLAVHIAATGATIATTGTSANVTIPNTASGVAPMFIRVAATVAASVKLGIAGVVATTADTQVQPGDAVILTVPRGVTTIAAIQVAAAGVVQISPLENA